MTASSSCAGMRIGEAASRVPGRAGGRRRAVATQADAVSTVRYPSGTASTARDAPSDGGDDGERAGATGPPTTGHRDLPRSVRTDAGTVATRDESSGPRPGPQGYIALMQAGGDCHRRERRPVLFLNTPTAAPLGADTWIHAEIMRRIDRTAWAPIAAHAFGPVDDPTPTHRVARRDPRPRVRAGQPRPRAQQSGRPSARCRRSSRRCRRCGRSPGSACWSSAAASEIIHTSDRPRDAFVAVVLGRLTGARSIVHVHVALQPDAGWAGCCGGRSPTPTCWSPSPSSSGDARRRRHGPGAGPRRHQRDRRRALASRHRRRAGPPAARHRARCPAAHHDLPAVPGEGPGRDHRGRRPAARRARPTSGC